MRAGLSRSCTARRLHCSSVRPNSFTATLASGAYQDCGRAVARWLLLGRISQKKRAWSARQIHGGLWRCAEIYRKTAIGWGELSDFATGPSPFPDTPWQEAQDRRNSFRPGFSSGCACRTSIVPIIAEAANKATHHVVRISLHPLRVCLFNSRSRTSRAMMTSRRRFMRSALGGSARPPG